jgi:hypothetical protein
VGLAITLLLVANARVAGAAAVERIAVPDGGTYPQAKTDSRGRIHLVYVKGDPMRADLYYARSDDGGGTFKKAIRVNSHPRSIIITGTVRGPHLAIGKADRPHVAWMGSDEAQPKFNGKATPMLYTRMSDAGDGFEPQRNVIQKYPGLDGGGSVAADREGNIYVAWHAPGGVAVGSGGGHGSHQHAAGELHEKHSIEKHERPAGHGGDEADRQVWVARSRDDGRTFDGEVQAIPKKTGVCGCCGIRIHAGENGKVFIAFRSATEMVNRDIHLLASDDYGKTFRIAAVDPWKVGTCVMSTASFAESTGGVLAAWETKEQIHVAAISPKSTETNALPVPGKDKARKHPSVAANHRGEYVVVWAVGTGWNKGGSVAWQVFDAEGRPVPSQAGRADGLPVWGVPAAVALPDGKFKVFF